MRTLRFTGTWALVLFLVASSRPLPVWGQREDEAQHHFDRIVTIFLENTNYSKAMKNPYLRNLAARGALLSRFHAIFHPSYPNYLAVTGGNYFWTLMDWQKTIDAPNISDLLEARGYTWKNYADGYPGHCFLGSRFKRYARKHVPLLSYKDVQEDAARCARVVDETQFERDWQDAALPSYSFYSPDMDHDGHDTNVTFAARWLRGFLEPKLADAERMRGTLFFVTFDESGFSPFDDNHIYAVALGPMVRSGLVSRKPHDLYDHLLMVEDNFGLDRLDAADDPDFRSPIDEIWRD